MAANLADLDLDPLLASIKEQQSTILNEKLYREIGAREADFLFTFAVGVTKYDLVRSLDPIKNKNYADIPQALTDVDSFITGAKSLVGYSDERLTRLIDRP